MSLRKPFFGIAKCVGDIKQDENIDQDLLVSILRLMDSENEDLWKVLLKMNWC